MLPVPWLSIFIPFFIILFDTIVDGVVNVRSNYEISVCIGLPYPYLIACKH